MWVATVCSEMESSEAIWRLVSPRETSTATSSSRGVSAREPLQERRATGGVSTGSPAEAQTFISLDWSRGRM